MFGKELQQSSIIFKDNGKCAEVCAIPFIDYDGKEHNEGDVVRTFNTSNKTFLNTALAKDIFDKRIGGPASMPIKSNRPFSLKEVLEVEAPHGSNFSNGNERYVRVV